MQFCGCHAVEACDFVRKIGATSDNGAAKALRRLSTFTFATIAAARAGIASISQMEAAVVRGDVMWPQLFTERALSRLCIVDREAGICEGERVVAPLGSRVMFCAASAFARL